MDWFISDLIFPVVSSIVGGLIAMLIWQLLFTPDAESRGATIAGWKLSLSIGIAFALLVFLSISLIDISTPNLLENEPLTVGTDIDSTLEETSRTIPRAAVQTEGVQLALSRVSLDKLDCDTLGQDIGEIPVRQTRDSNVHEVISILIEESQYLSNEGKTNVLECAGFLAKLSHYSQNRDRELTRVIDKNIEADRCNAARELTDHLHYTNNRSEQKARVALMCLGRN